MKVAILGCGPAGMLAAHAATQRGADVTIFSEGEPSPIGGAQYLHSHIPGLTDENDPTMLTYVKLGPVDGYARKAYGEPQAKVSWDTFVTGDYPSWSLKDAYESLWSRFENRVEKLVIGPTDIEPIASEFDEVFCSIPAKALCCDITHSFPGQEVVFTEERFVDVDEMIIYNGRTRDPWYRAAKLFGYCSAEYAIHNGRGPNGMERTRIKYRGVKPVSTDCNCFAHVTNFHRIGRFGRWLRGIHTDDAYRDVYERVQQ